MAVIIVFVTTAPRRCALKRSAISMSISMEHVDSAKTDSIWWRVNVRERINRVPGRRAAEMWIAIFSRISCVWKTLNVMEWRAIRGSVSMSVLMKGIADRTMTATLDMSACHG